MRTARPKAEPKSASKEPISAIDWMIPVTRMVATAIESQRGEPGQHVRQQPRAVGWVRARRVAAGTTPSRVMSPPAQQAIATTCTKVRGRSSQTGFWVDACPASAGSRRDQHERRQKQCGAEPAAASGDQDGRAEDDP